ncbi:hypothetical protein DICVIV_02362 [Dictyocaulus viviparus]|uniref:Major facilitator superfamily (MFS) profile domain-containing protein n=1 Tax=Dictyocaulus viviparus TaxID=29172 RepID=A0A0D8YA44_DICVI|nr:hypothetical protein DICVIV_02362 [Dictyocaulus viviparus]
MIVSPLIGIWSDKKGRKNPLLLAIFGFSIYTLFQLLATLTYSTMNIYYWLFAGEFILGLTGSIGSVFSTSLAIVIDDCRHQLNLGSSTVPLRIGVASFLQSIGTLLGVLIMSLFAVQTVCSNYVHQLSYIKVTLIQIGLTLIAFIYSYFIVRETHYPENDTSLFDSIRTDSSTSTTTYQRNSVTSIISKNILLLSEVK